MKRPSPKNGKRTLGAVALLATAAALLVWMRPGAKEVLPHPLASNSIATNGSHYTLFAQMTFPKSQYSDPRQAAQTELSKLNQTYSLPGTSATVENVINFALSNEMLQLADSQLFIAKSLQNTRLQYPANTKTTALTFLKTVTAIFETNGMAMLKRGNKTWVFPAAERERYTSEIHED